jgi:hypothetical protein
LLILSQFIMVHHVQFHLLLWLVSKMFSFCFFLNFYYHLVKCNSYLFIYYFTINCSRNGIRKKYKWKNKLSMSNKCSTTTNSREKMVYGTTSDHIRKRNSTIWIDFYWNVNFFSKKKLFPLLVSVRTERLLSLRRSNSPFRKRNPRWKPSKLSPFV